MAAGNRPPTGISCDICQISLILLVLVFGGYILAQCALCAVQMIFKKSPLEETVFLHAGKESGNEEFFRHAAVAIDLTAKGMTAFPFKANQCSLCNGKTAVYAVQIKYSDEGVIALCAHCTHRAAYTTLYNWDGSGECP
jgi:hypothetical protein